MPRIPDISRKTALLSCVVAVHHRLAGPGGAPAKQVVTVWLSGIRNMGIAAVRCHCRNTQFWKEAIQ